MQIVSLQLSFNGIGSIVSSIDDQPKNSWNMRLHMLFVGLLYLLPRLATANHIPDFKQQIFIETWANLAVDQMRQHGIPASITLAQAIVESGWGDGYVARLGNNYFCIKGNNGWTGPVVKAKDDDADSSSFRQYLSIEESFADHAKFLRENRRYKALFDLNAYDYKGWAHGLKASGYATKPDYAEYLIATIEKYGLYSYDYAVPVEQIRLLDIPFEEAEEDAEPMDAPSLEPQGKPIQEKMDGAASAPAEYLLTVPGYRLGPAAAAAKPTVAPSPAVKMPLMMPEAIPKFERR